MTYFSLLTLGDSSNEDLCMLYSGLKDLGVEKVRLSRGRWLGDDAPVHPRIEMSDRSPGMQLGTLVGNTVHLLILHQTALDVLRAGATLGEVETIPIEIINHKGRVASDQHVIVNPIGSVDCIDLDRSDVMWAKNEPGGRPIEIKTMVLRRDALRDAPDLFRPTHSPSKYILSERGLNSLRGHGFTNLFALPLEVTEPA